MNLKVVTCALLALAGIPVALVKASDVSVYTVSSVEELLAVEHLVASPSDTASPITIKVSAGRYLLKDSFRIGRSHVSLIGESGAKLVLTNGVNEPVLVIGTQEEVTRPEHTITNIVVQGLEIDGNKEHQNSEFSALRPWIRNNGIDVRAVAKLTVHNVIANNNRSGGLVISWGCSNVRVTDSTFAKNYFDGVAFYASTDVDVIGCTMTKNQAAGVSLDNEFVDSRFTRCTIDANGDVGVFARSSARVEFNDCIIKASGNWGVFLAHDDHGRGVIDVVIKGGQLTGNRGGVCVASVNEIQSRGTRVVGAQFSANEISGRRNIQTSGSLIDATDIAAGSKLPVLNLATIR